MDERVFCKYVHDALRDTGQDTTVPPRRNIPSDCSYLRENDLCSLNGVGQLCACAFCDPDYDWDWVASHNQTYQR